MHINVDNSGTTETIWLTQTSDQLKSLDNFTARSGFDVSEVRLIRLTKEGVPSEHWIELARQRAEHPLGIHDAQALRNSGWPVSENWKSTIVNSAVSPIFIVFAGELVMREKVIKVKRMELKERTNAKTGKKEQVPVAVEVPETVVVPHVPVFFTIPLKDGACSPVCSLYEAGEGFGFLGEGPTFLAVLS